MLGILLLDKFALVRLKLFTDEKMIFFPAEKRKLEKYCKAGFEEICNNRYNYNSRVTDCEKGDLKACYSAANSYLLLGNRKAASSFFEKLYSNHDTLKSLCDSDDMFTCTMYINLFNPAMNNWLLRNCNAGIEDCCLKITDEQLLAGSMLATRLCKSGNVRACHYMAHTLRDSGQIVHALQNFQRACDGGFIASCTISGFFALKMGKERVAMKLFSRSCQHNFQKKRSCFQAGKLKLKYGEKSKARAAFFKSCTAFNKQACVNYISLIKKGF